MGKRTRKPDPSSGTVFGLLTVGYVFEAPGNGANVMRMKRWATCTCACGTIKTIDVDNLFGRQVRSCGCLKKTASARLKTMHAEKATLLKVARAFLAEQW